MEQHTLLLEYLKEQYAQARQHETLRTNCTTFLTASSGLILGFNSKNGDLSGNMYFGLLIFLNGLANYQINKSHFFGNRFHTTVAKYVRTQLEIIPTWEVLKPIECRRQAIEELGFKNLGIKNVGDHVQKYIQRVPCGVMAIGLVLVLTDKKAIDALQTISARMLG